MVWGTVVVIFLDTHAVVWLYAGQVGQFSDKGHDLINSSDLFICPMVRLELQYLYEIKRLAVKPDQILTDLHKRIGLSVDLLSFMDAVTQSLKETWARDPFDRLIVAHAIHHKAILLTQDGSMQANYKKALW